VDEYDKVDELRHDVNEYMRQFDVPLNVNID